MHHLLTQIKEEPTIYLFRKTWEYAGERRPLYVCALLLLLVSGLIIALEPLVIAKIFNEIQANGVTEDNIVRLLLLTALLPVVILSAVLSSSLAFYLRVRVRLEVINNYKKFLVDQIFNRPISWIDDHDSGALIDKTNKASHALRNFMRRLEGISRVLVAFVTSLVAIYFYSGAFFFAAVLVMISIFYVITRFDAKIIPMIKQLNTLYNEHSAVYYDALSNATSVKILSIVRTVSSNVQTAYEKIFTPQLESTRLDEIKWFIASSIFTLLVFSGAFVAYFFQVLTAGETVLIGSLAALYQYLNRLDDAFFTFSNLYSDLRQLKADNENAQEIEDYSAQEEHRERIQVHTSISFAGLAFDYNQAEEISALRDVSLTINKGDKVALIGGSGSGKTTFLKVVHGLYEGVRGKIEVDKQVITGGLHQVNLGTTLVPQDPELFSSSVRENITFGLDVSDEKIRTVTDLACFSHVAEELPEGLGSRINEKGVNLSGGQKQRLALARALLFAQDKDIILLDESTSSVDAETEVEIYQNIFNHFRGKTFIASIHKLNLLKYFDTIVIFDKGVVVDQGSFEELRGRNKEFQTLWKSYVDTQS